MIHTGVIKSIIALIVFIVIVGAAAWVGSNFEPGQWYTTINKPSWTPPGIVFGPVWTILYILMAVSAWLVWMKVGFDRAAIALTLFVIQLAFNAIWSVLFFGLHLIGLALIDIILLWLAVMATTIAFWRHRRLAGLLMLPYMAWVSFAVILYINIWRLNF